MNQSRVLLIDETVNSPLKLVESYATPVGNPTGAVLATLFGTLSDYGNETRNDRWYTGPLWRRVLNTELFREAIATKTLYGEADHPLDVENRLETHLPYVSHIIRDVKINEGKQVVEGYVDILDTPNGRIIKTLLDYGCQIGVSSRGSGDLVNIDGKTVVDENTYDFITWDIVARPSNKKARLHEIDTVDKSGKPAFESLKEQIKVMKSNNDIQALRLAESLVINTDIPDKDEVIKMIKESYEEKGKSSDNSINNVSKSDLDEAHSRIMELKSKILELDTENKSLSKSLETKENTISELNDLNNTLGSMLSSYMDKLSTIHESEHTMKNQNESTESQESKNQEIDFSTITNMINQLSDKLNSTADIIAKIDQYLKSEDTSSEVEELSNDLDKAKTESRKLETLLKNSQNENVRLIKKISGIMSEYFKLRCSQLGLNESIARKEFNNRLYEYDLRDIDDVLTGLYSNRSSSKKLTESVNISSLGSLQLTGSMKSKGISYQDDDIDIGLVESIKQVRLK